MTNGVVSITVGGKMAMKVVAGSNGMKAVAVARQVRAMGDVPTITEMVKICRAVGFGNHHNLVIQTPEETYYEGDGFLSPAYEVQFGNPRANPRFPSEVSTDLENTIVIDFEPAVVEATESQPAKVLQAEDVKISEYDENQLRSLETDSICAVQKDGSSTRRVLWNLQTALRMGFTTLSRGEAIDGQVHPPRPEWFTNDDVAKVEATSPAPEVPGELTVSGMRWNELHELAARFAAAQYYREFPEQAPENHECNNTDVVVGIPGLMVLLEDGSPLDNSYVWAFVRGIGWRLAYYEAFSALSWEILRVNSRQEMSGRRSDADIAAFVPIQQPNFPDWGLCETVRLLRQEMKILKPIIDEVKAIFPNASEEYYQASHDYEVYATEDHGTGHILGSQESRVAAWGKALKFAKSQSGKRVAERMFGKPSDVSVQA